MNSQDRSSLFDDLTLALESRQALFDAEQSSALRLFNGFAEGGWRLTADVYGRTLLLISHEKSLAEAQDALAEAQGFLIKRLPWLTCVIHKARAGGPVLRRGVVAFGGIPDRRISEYGVHYAIDLMMNQDASFYLDTRCLRGWLIENAAGWDVLNTFAYTGSLGVAALAGGAASATQVDLNRKFLQLAEKSSALNGYDPQRMTLRTVNFFSAAGGYKKSGRLFDCVIADPPFFSATAGGQINLSSEWTRLINKLRPLVKDGGRLAIVNNALFLSGAEFIQSLEKLGEGGYLSVETILPVPPDVTGFSRRAASLPPPADPAPFNHPTKIVVLKIRRKS